MSGPGAAYNFALALGSGVAAHVVARHLHVPSIVLLLATGVALGPDGLGWIAPDALGDGLSAFVSLAVAVILFEGGLGLDLQRLRAAATPVRRLVTWGALITMFGAGIAAQLILDWPPERALLYGSLVIVTGPTVVRPLLRLVPVHNRLTTVLEAEGLLIDPVGAIVAAVALEVVVQQTVESFASGALGLVSRLAFGLGAGLAIGGNLALLLRPARIVPAGLENLVVLGGGLAGFALCESFLPESGILAVVIAAAVLANLAPERARAVGEFQEQLTLGLIGMLFVLLAADVRLSTVLALGWPGVATVAALAFVVRPIGVLWCTRGSELTIRERLFAAWLGPRGVVAAAIASVTATTLEAVGVPGGPELRALVFLSIALSVVVLGGLAPVAAWALRVRSPGRTTTVILGADELPIVLGEVLRDGGQTILFTDKNPDCCRAAEQRGFPVVFGDALSPTTLARLRLERAKSAIGLTTNAQLNHVFTIEAQEEYDVSDVYVAAARQQAEESSRLARRHAVRVLFDRPKDVERWNVRLRHQQTERVRLKALPPAKPATERGANEAPPPASIATQATAPNARAAAEAASPDAFVILAVRRGGHWQPMHEGWTAKAGDEAIALIHRDEALSARAALLALGWQIVEEDAAAA
ncbi:MAG: sodium:proton antiporter [Myxococcota bacterium]